MHRRQFLEQLAGISLTLPALALPTLESYAQAVHERAKANAGLRTLSAAQAATLNGIADLLLPPTDTIGATQVGVCPFIDVLLSESMLEQQRERFLAGLAQIDARCRTLHGAAFTAASASQQQALIRELDGRLPRPASSPAEIAARARAPVTAESAYAEVKALVVLGYFTSEPVAKGLIHLPIIPGRYDGCIHT